MSAIETPPHAFKMELLDSVVDKKSPETLSGTTQSLHSSSPQSEQSSVAFNSPSLNSSSSTSTQQEAYNTNFEYYRQLMEDSHRLKELALSPGFTHLERLLDDEVSKVRSKLFHNNEEETPLVLPEPEGETVTLIEKVFVPVDEYPDFNFVGRILGPRGQTAKDLQNLLGCKIMVRGRGSMRDRKKEEMNRGKPNWDHLEENLHVLITVNDTANRAKLKLEKAIKKIQALLVPITEGEDELKKGQLIELALLNGTYRDVNSRQSVSNSTSLVPPVLPQIPSFDDHLSMLAATNLSSLNPFRSLTASQAAAQVGAPLILTSNGRQYQTHPIAAAGLISGPTPQHHLHLNNLAQQAANAAAQPSPPLIDGSLLYSAAHPAVHAHHLTPYDFQAAQYATYAALTNNVAVASAQHGIASPQQAEKRKAPVTVHGRTASSIGTNARYHPYTMP